MIGAKQRAREIDRAEGDGLLVVDERAHDLRREGPVERDAHRRHGQPGAAGDAEKGQHPLPVAGGKIVRDERHHGQADAHADVQRQALDLQDDAHCGQLDVAVAGGELVDDDVRQVVEQEAQRRGTPTEKMARMELFCTRSMRRGRARTVLLRTFW